MADVQHANLKPGIASGIHVAHAWDLASNAARLALTLTADDVGKIARQVETGEVSYWVLLSVTGGVGAWSRIDNTGGLELAPANTAASAPIGTNTTGNASTASRSNHSHEHGDQPGGSLHSVATGAAAGFMSAADRTKLDGIATGATNTAAPPAAPGSAPPELADATGATGTVGTYATATHTHAHGNRGGGTLHAAATTSTAGFQSAADKTKLDALPTNAALTTSLDGKADKITPITTVATQTRTLAAGDNATTLVFTYTAGENTLTVPPNATTALPVGYSVAIFLDVAGSAYPLRLAPGTGVALALRDAAGTSAVTTSTITLAPGGSCTLTKIGTNRWWVAGEAEVEAT